MKSFLRNVLVLFTALILVVGVVALSLSIVHISPEKMAFFNALTHRGVSDTLSDEKNCEIWRFGDHTEIPFDVRYTREVALALDFKNTLPPAGMFYSGRLLIRYYQGNRIVASKVYAKIDNGILRQGDQNLIILDTQVLPLHGGTSKHSVVVDVLQADPRFIKYKDAMKMQVRGTFSW